MNVFKRGRVCGTVCVGILSALAAIRAASPPVTPATPPSSLVGVIPSPLDSLKQQPTEPQLPQLTSGSPADLISPTQPNPAVPVLPPKREVKQSTLNLLVPPALPPNMAPIAPPNSLPLPNVPAIPEHAITEPVATIHRFECRYLGTHGTRVMLELWTADGKAQILSKPRVQKISPNDEALKEDVKRIEVPRGQVRFHSGRVFLLTPRELLVIDSDCKLDWKLTLPGKADNGERLLDITGFDHGNIIVASHHEPKPGSVEKPSGRIHSFDVKTGRQTRLITVERGFDQGAEFVLDTTGQLLVAVGHERASIYPLTTPVIAGTALAFTKMPVTHLRLQSGTAVGSTPNGIAITHKGRPLVILPDCTNTACCTLTDTSGTQFLAPVKSKEGAFSLVAVDMTSANMRKWSVPVPKAITTAPLVRGKSAYFVVGNTLYRVNANDGTICWKHSLPLCTTDTLTNLEFVGDELYASGGDVLVRIAERAELKPSLFFINPFGPR